MLEEKSFMLLCMMNMINLVNMFILLLSFLRVLAFQIPIINVTYIMGILSLVLAFRYLGFKKLFYYKTNKRMEDTMLEQGQLIEDYMLSEQKFLLADFSLDDLAEELNLDKEDLLTVLKNNYQQSFIQFVAKYRIEYSIELMHGEGVHWSVDALALASGFNSKSSFNKYFKLFKEHTPAQYRELVVEGKL